MSQLRPTTVHRFIVKKTIEEAIAGLRSRGRAEAQDALSPTKRKRQAEESRQVTWAQLRALFQDEVDLTGTASTSTTAEVP